MHILVPIWRMDTASARRLYGFSEALSDDEVTKAIEQVRFQQRGSTVMPPWLQAFAGFACVGEYDDAPQFFEDGDEKALLMKLVERLDTDPEGPIIVFRDGAETAKQLRMRMLLHGLSSSFSQSWPARFTDGEAWQTRAFVGEPEAAAAVLSLATESGSELFEPWEQTDMQAEQACAQALAIRELVLRGWI